MKVEGSEECDFSTKLPDLLLPTCPECGSASSYRDGFHKKKGRTVQRHLCRSCGRRFSDSIPKNEVDIDIGRESFEGSHPNKDLPHDVFVSSNVASEVTLNDLPLFRGENVTSHTSTTAGQDIYNLCEPNTIHRVCASEKSVKNLVSVQEIVRNVTAGDVSENRNILFEFAWYMKKKGYAETTGKTRCTLLKVLLRSGANLKNTESVKDAIAKQT